jgi:hypothetical protein
MELIVVAGVVGLIYLRFRNRDRATAPRGMVEPVGWSPTTNWAAVPPLMRAEVRRVLLHPAFLTGVAITPFILVLATIGQNDPTWITATGGTALGLVPLGWLTIVAANLVTLRPQRLGTAELFATAPAPQAVRTAGLLATMIGPAAVATLIGGGWLFYLGRRENLTGSLTWAEAGAGVLIVAGAVVVGVAVARWLPNPAFGVVAVIVVILIQARFLDMTTWPWHRNEGDPLRFLGFLAEPTSAGAQFLEFRPAGWHLLYLVGWTTILAAVAMARSGMHRAVAVTLAIGIIAAGSAGIVQTRPLSAAQRTTMISSLIDPSTVQVCVESNQVEYCAYPEYRTDIDGWRDTVEATLAVLPHQAATTGGQLEVHQRPATIVGNSDCAPIRFVDSLDPDVAAGVSPAELWRADGMVHPAFGPETFPCSDRDVHGFFLAVQTAAWATGLPPAPHDDNVRCTGTGQARAVVTLWAAAAASHDGANTLEDLIVEGAVDGSPLITFDGWNNPPMWGVDYAVGDARVALAMLEHPAADVRSIIEGHWDDLTDPSTPTGELTRLLGLDVATAGQSTGSETGCS